MYTIYFSFLASNSLETDVMNRFLEWSESHAALLRNAITLTIVVNVFLILAATAERKRIMEKIKDHNKIEKLFILSFFGTFLTGASLLIVMLGVLGLQHSGEFPLIGLTALLLILLLFLVSFLTCLATFLFLFAQLFIFMKPAGPAIDEEINWGGTPVLVIILAFFVLSFLLAFFSATAGSIGGSVLLISLPLVLILKPYKRNLSTIGFRKPVTKILLLSLPLIPVLIFGNGLIYQITERIMGKFPLEDLMEDLVKESPILMSIEVGVLGPVGEELFFRGFAHTALRRKYGFRKGIIFSSLFFGVYHLIPWQIPYAVIAGFILAYVYEKTHSIYPPILFHVINNSLAVLGIWVWG